MLATYIVIIAIGHGQHSSMIQYEATYTSEQNCLIATSKVAEQIAGNSINLNYSYACTRKQGD